MSKHEISTSEKVFAAFWAVLTGFFLFDAGLDAMRHYYVSMSLDFILGAFFAVALALKIGSLFHEAVGNAISEMADEATGKLDKLFEQFAADMAKNTLAAPVSPFGSMPRAGDEHQAALQEVLASLLGQYVTDGKPPTEEQLAKISAEFRTITEHDIDLKLEMGGLKVKISKEELGKDMIGGAPAGSTAAKRTQIQVTDADEVRERRSVAGKKAAATRKARQEAAEADKVRAARRAKRAATIAAKQK